MSKHIIRVERDHLDRLVKKPLGGIIELIWNAIDADAKNIEVKLIHNSAGGFDALEVIDDGTGITPERADLSFGRLGGSWKSSGTTTEGGRPLHGRAGQGRIGAFGLGEVLTWTSTAVGIHGQPRSLKITGRRSSLNEVDVTELDRTQTKTGTVVRVDGLSEAALKWLDSRSALESLTATFALVIEMHGLSLTFGGQLIDPARMRKDKTEYELKIEDLATDHPMKLIIIEWKQPQKNRALMLCDGKGTALHETKAGIHAPGFHFTAYLHWEGFSTLRDILALADLGAEPISTVLEGAKEKLREHFDDRKKAKGAELMAAWKADKTYPYDAPASNPLEKSERELFEIVAVAASPVIESADAPSRKLSLRLIREALENNPTGLQQVLREVIELPEEQIAELSLLLKKTSISSMIEATRQVTDRLDFLIALEQMIFGKDLRKKLLERSQLQKILEAETWIFREEYALTANDVTLTTALKEHADLLRADDSEPLTGTGEVLDTEGRRVVVDMMLSRIIETSENRRHHIVIELKRPTVHIGFKEIEQISKYAHAVAGDSRFAMTDSTWEFWIVGDKVSDNTRMLTHQKGREVGVVAESNDFPLTIRAMSWAQVIQNARYRMAFIKKSFAYAATDESASRYLTQTYSHYLPGSLIEVTESSSSEENDEEGSAA
ncbi:ATP-binding protein [Arthrobacter sp. ISL-48]|uniref:ATP-binding protein n=1 Tax=Arthrobacter sp. ISL-48 TaxID=2819110 RepID=UPI001BED12CF|nr:ATP-binding protein [Arthrobacter sp. ISL-48]MBT2532795.1 ATP-binding protein [Arthrobacter sp. ISL-48]